MQSCIYKGHIAHVRLAPVGNAFHYPVFALYLNLAELETLDKKHTLFSHNRFNILSFYERDHGALTPTGLKEWAIQTCQTQLSVTPDKVMLLCFPRILGYVFNPISLFFCYEGDVLRAALYEVCNAYKQRHTYCLPANNAETQHHIMQKTFYVSPYLPADCVYECRLAPPAAHFALRIEQSYQNKPLFTAIYTGEQKLFTNKQLLKCLLTYPMLTFAITRRIWWQALKLTAKGLRFRAAPSAAKHAVSAPRQDDKAA